MIVAGERVAALFAAAQFEYYLKINSLERALAAFREAFARCSFKISSRCSRLFPYTPTERTDGESCSRIVAWHFPARQTSSRSGIIEKE